MRTFPTLLGLLGALALPAAAQDDTPPPDRPERPDPWTRVLERADQDGDGRISKDEFRGPPERFAEMDKNGDGFLTRDEFVPREDRPRMGGEGQRGGRGGGGPAGMRRRAPEPGHLLVRAADKDRSGDVTEAEWIAFLASLKADANGVVAPEALAAALKQGLPADAPGRGAGREVDPAGLFDKDKSGKVELKDLKALFAEMDKNKDGALAKDEMPQPRRMGGRGFGGMMLVRIADADRSGDVTAAEWNTLVTGITGEDGAVSVEKLVAMMPQRRGGRGGGPDGQGGPGGGFRGGQGGGDRNAMLARMLDHDEDGKATSKDLAAMFGELDKNKDGALSADEMPRRRGGRGFGRGPGRGPGPGGGSGESGD